jgi:hypothetical protein
VKIQPVQFQYGVGACRRVTGTIMGARRRDAASQMMRDGFPLARNHTLRLLMQACERVAAGSGRLSAAASILTPADAMVQAGKTCIAAQVGLSGSRPAGMIGYTK